jgi:hypothetical protein
LARTSSVCSSEMETVSVGPSPPTSLTSGDIVGRNCSTSNAISNYGLHSTGQRFSSLPLSWAGGYFLPQPMQVASLP